MQQEGRMAKRKAIPKAVKDRLLVEAMHRCCLCPEHQEVVDLHHIVPISEEGPDTEEDLMRQQVSQEQR
jgi:5-methylcytosine-specific restriction endonuclease McrA